MPDHIPDNSGNRGLGRGPNVVIEHTAAEVCSRNYGSGKGSNPPCLAFRCLQRSAVGHGSYFWKKPLDLQSQRPLDANPRFAALAGETAMG